MKFHIIVPMLFMVSSVSQAGDPATLEKGHQVFQENCTACHGAEGNGRGPAAAAISGAKPRDFTTGVFKYGSSDDEIFKTITNGVSGTAMPPWSTLSEADRKAVIVYIKSLKK